MKNECSKNDKFYNAIKSCILFSGLNDNEVLDICDISQTTYIKSGQTLFSEGDTALAFYIVVSGQIRIFKLSPNGREQTLLTAGTGSSIAEAALFVDETYPAYAEAKSDAELARIDKQKFLDLLISKPQLAINMIGLLSKRLKSFARKIEQLSLMGVVPRLAEYIVQSSGDNPDLKLDITKGDLASLLGTVPETLSRAFTKLKAGGYISESGNVVHIQSLDGLKEIASSHE
jgi:CRP/FNR family transcriptional regulator